MFQGGAGTSTNMNANEVIANRGLELLGHAKGEYEYLHPNDDVNCSQSTNDVYPRPSSSAVILSLEGSPGRHGRAADGPEREGEQNSPTSSRWAAPKTRTPCR